MFTCFNQRYINNFNCSMPIANTLPAWPFELATALNIYQITQSLVHQWLMVVIELKNLVDGGGRIFRQKQNKKHPYTWLPEVDNKQYCFSTFNVSMKHFKLFTHNAKHTNHINILHIHCSPNVRLKCFVNSLCLHRKGLSFVIVTVSAYLKNHGFWLVQIIVNELIVFNHMTELHQLFCYHHCLLFDS